MKRGFLMITLAALIILPLAVFGCKGKVEKPQAPETSAAMPEALQSTAENVTTPEPAQGVATETIPPSAAPQGLAGKSASQAVSAASDRDARNKDIQKALKNAGFYTGAADGKIGPKTKKAIEDFQKSKNLKVDGKVGPKTWAELEKYLAQQ